MDLKSRGFENAGLYDPPGVGGTHVMYVLHHADKPSIYAGLPDNPHISILVEVWKGVLKPLALAGIALGGGGGLRPLGRRRAERGASREDEVKRPHLMREVGKHDIRRRRHELPRERCIRNTTAARLNHWITAACFVLLMLSGLAMFHPPLFFLTGLFGGGQWTRAIHPWIGCVLLVSFAVLFVRFWRHNLWVRDDIAWLPRSAAYRATTRSSFPKSAATTPARNSCSGRWRCSCLCCSSPAW